jgi:hypothetical protein
LNNLSADAGFLAYWPSCIAAASILSAANEIPNWSYVKPEHAESWCEGLRKVSNLLNYDKMNKKNYGFIYISFPKHIFMCISGKNYRVL